MKIYEIGTGYTPIPAQMGAATEIVVEELTKAFLKQGIPVEIIDIAATDRAQTTLSIREVKVPKCFSGTDVQLGLMHKLKRVVYSIALARELKKLLKQTDEKVVLHFHNQYNLFFFLKLTSAKLRRKAVIAYTNHSGIWRLPWEEIENTVHKRYFQEAECMKRADVVFVLNQETKQNILMHLGVPERSVVMINNGVNTDVYHPLLEEEKAQAKKKWGLEGKKVILQVGSVNENKGQLRSLESLHPFLRGYADIVFAYAGGIVDEAYQQKIRDFADANQIGNQVLYLGMIKPGNELNEVYNTAESTILSSGFESFGMVVIESLSAGIPVFLCENFPHEFGEGIVRFSPDNLVERMALRLSGTDVCLKKQARENAVVKYSWNKVAADCLAAILEPNSNAD